MIRSTNHPIELSAKSHDKDGTSAGTSLARPDLVGKIGNTGELAPSAEAVSLRKIAAALLAKAAGGDVPAINVLADRTDGKVAQALIGDGEQDSVRVHHKIIRKIVEPHAEQERVHGD